MFRTCVKGLGGGLGGMGHVRKVLGTMLKGC